MFPSQLYADIPDLTDTELRIILVCLGHQGIMTMDDVQQRTGRSRQVYEAVKSLEQRGWLVRHKVASLGPVAWRWQITRYEAALPPTPPVEAIPEAVPADPTPKKAKAKAPPKEKPITAQQHPAVAAYVEMVRRRPTHAAAEQIATSITDVDKWREAVKQYILRGWNPMNVSGMIQVYNGEITLVTRKGKYSTAIPHPPPDVAKAAFEQYLSSEGDDE